MLETTRTGHPLAPFSSRRRLLRLLTVVGLLTGLFVPAGAQTEQVVEVTIKDSTFLTKQMPLQLDVPTLILVRNEDEIRHDFGSSMFQRTMTRAESGGVIPYGRGIEGVYLDPGKEVSLRFTIERPGRFEFTCSIHPQMKGELLLLTVGTV